MWNLLENPSERNAKIYWTKSDCVANWVQSFIDTEKGAEKNTAPRLAKLNEFLLALIRNSNFPTSCRHFVNPDGLVHSTAKIGSRKNYSCSQMRSSLIYQRQKPLSLAEQLSALGKSTLMGIRQIIRNADSSATWKDGTIFSTNRAGISGTDYLYLNYKIYTMCVGNAPIKVSSKISI